MKDPRLKVRPGLDDVSFQIADQLDECELLQRVIQQLGVAFRHRDGDDGAFKEFYARHLEPQVLRERERLEALIVLRGEVLARLDSAAPAGPPPAAGKSA